MSKAEVLLEVEDLVVRYPVPRGAAGILLRRPRQDVHAVEGVSFTVRRGEFVALVGESGCGKTSIAQAIMRMTTSSAGSIRIRGEDITDRDRRSMRPLRRRMQIIYQDPYEALDPRFSVGATIEEPLLVHGLGGSKRERRRMVLDALDHVHMRPPDLYVDRLPHELSGGQRQRVAIAASLVLEPELLVADEPVSMLDVSVRAGILTLLDELRGAGLGILMITHNLSTAAHYADRIAVMYLGRIVEEGPARSVVRNPRHPYTKALVSVVPQVDPRRRTNVQILRGETPNPIDVPSGCRFHPRCPEVIDRCEVDDPVLVRVDGLQNSSDTSDLHRAACVHVQGDLGTSPVSGPPGQPRAPLPRD